MKVLPAGLEAMLASGVTTLCRCWLLVRSDGALLGFTDHDGDLTFGGVTYEAAAGMTTSAIDQSLGLNVDTVDIAGALQSDALNEADLAKGLFDNAALTIFVVDWSDVANRTVIFAGSIGEVSRGRTAFKAEMRGLEHALNQPRGRLYQRVCDADLGDARCGININGAAFKGTGAVTAALSGRAFRASGLGAFADGWFTRGLVTWTAGANAGAKMEVKGHSNAGGTVSIELVEQMPVAIAIADAFTVTAGCDKSFETCRARFNNAVNFRGFPHMPGNDFVTSYPNKGEGNDGQALGGGVFA